MSEVLELRAAPSTYSYLKLMSMPCAPFFALASVCIGTPQVVFADEPTGNLDSKTKTEVMDMICSFARDFNQTIVLVTHDDNMAQYADRIVTLLDGRIIGDRLT